MGEINEWGPSSRVSSLDIPGDWMLANEAGCTVKGSKYGASLYGLMSLLPMLAPDMPQPEPGVALLNPYLNPDEEGEISLVILSQLLGWATGDTADAAGSADLTFLMGDYKEGSFFIQPSSYIDDDPTGTPYIQFPADLSGGMLSTEPGPFNLNLPVLDLMNLEITLAETQIEGSLSVEEGGFGVTRGFIQGYITRDALIYLIETLQAACAQDPRPEQIDSMCTNDMVDINNTELVMGLLTSVVTMDALVVDGTPNDCAGDGDQRNCCGEDECNAVAVCLPAEMKGVIISGISDNAP